MRISATGLKVLGIFLMGICAAEEATVYHETFDHYGFNMPGFSESCVMAEFPPSLKYLEFRPAKPDSVYKNGFFHLPKEAPIRCLHSAAA